MKNLSQVEIPTECTDFMKEAPELIANKAKLDDD